MTSSMAGPGRRLLDAGWRVLLYGALLVGAVLLLSQGANFGLHALHVHFDRPAGASPVEELLLSQVVILSGAIVAVAAMRRLDRDPSVPLLPRRWAGGSHFAQGLVWGFGAFAATIAGIAALGGYRIVAVALSGPSLFYYGALWGVAAVLNGAAENLALLGYPLQRLGRAAGVVPAIALMAGLFALSHLGNAGESPLGLISVFLIAASLGLAIFLTGDLWLSIGIHTGGIFAEDFVFSVPDSGVVYTGRLLNSAFVGPAWLTGGDAGPEASAVALPVFVVFLFLLWRTYRR